ncbi:MAG TPA: hypothetical protein VFZ00_01555 [Solirubrobacter sp.]|nr:hypothetical protein [Solirubrobacter sp.]
MPHEYDPVRARAPRYHRRRRRPNQDNRGAKLLRLAIARRDDRRIARAERAAGEAVVL